MGYYPALRARLRIRGALPNLALARDRIALTLDGAPAELSVVRTLDSEVVYESEILALERKALSLRGLAEGLAAEYLFYEGSGSTLHDSSGYANHGTIYGASWVQLENSKWALKFDGVDDYVEVPDSETLRPAFITIEAIAKTEAWTATAYQAIVQKYVAGDGGYFLAFYNSKKAIDWALIFVDGSVMERQSSLRGDAILGKYFHIVLTYDGSRVRLFINGELDSEYSKASSGIKNTSAPLQIGRWYAHSLKGEIALVRVWSRALSEEEIKALYELAKKVVPIG